MVGVYKQWLAIGSWAPLDGRFAGFQYLKTANSEAPGWHVKYQTLGSAPNLFQGVNTTCYVLGGGSVGHIIILDLFAVETEEQRAANASGRESIKRVGS